MRVHELIEALQELPEGMSDAEVWADGEGGVIGITGIFFDSLDEVVLKTPYSNEDE